MCLRLSVRDIKGWASGLCLISSVVTEPVRQVQWCWLKLCLSYTILVIYYNMRQT